MLDVPVGKSQCLQVILASWTARDFTTLHRAAASLSIRPFCEVNHASVPPSLSPSLQASRDLVCFLQLDHVNVYYGQDYRSKYKAPTDYCLALKVKHSPYIFH